MIFFPLFCVFVWIYSVGRPGLGKRVNDSERIKFSFIPVLDVIGEEVIKKVGRKFLSAERK